MKTNLKTFRAAGLAGALMLSTSAFAATAIWNGAGADDNLATPGNWLSGVAPATTDDIIFTGFSRNNPVATAAQIYFTITFDAGAGPFVFSGSTITTGTTTPTGGSITNLSAYPQTFNGSFNPRLGTIMASGGDIILNGGFNVGNGGNSTSRNIVVDGARNVIVNSVLTGTGTDTSAGGQLTKNGAGTLFLNGSSPAWTGKITLNLGTLAITNANALGSAAGSTVINSSGGATVWDGKLVLSNSLTLAEPFTLGARQQGSLNSAHILNTATTNTLNGNLNLTTGGSRYNLQSDGGKLIVAGTVNAGTLTGVREFRVAGAAEGELRGPLSGGGAGVAFSVIKDGSGLWTLQSTNSVNGPVLVNAGVFALGSAGKLTGSTNITVAAGATLDVSAVTGGFTLGASQTLAGSGVVTGSLTTVAGSQISPGGAGVAGTLTFASGLTQTAGTTNRIELANSTSPGGANDLINITGNLDPNGATIVIASLNTLVVPGTYRLFNYTGSKLSNFGPLVADARYSFTLDNATPGQVNLLVSGSNSNLVWSGGTTTGNWDITASTNWNANTSVFFQSDLVTFDDTTASNIVNLVGALYPTAVNVNGASNYTFQGAGKLSGATGLTKNGNSTFFLNTSNNNYTGLVTINGGTLTAGNTSALGATNAGTVVAAGGTLNLNALNLGAEAITFSGTGATGNGAIVNNGADQQNALQFVSLADDASGGGTGRWDVRGGAGSGTFSGRFDLSGHTFSKVGASRVGIIDSIATNAGSLQIASGLMSITRSMVDGPGVIDISTNTIYFENCSTGYVVKPILSSGGRIQLTGSAFTLGSAITNTAGLTVDNALDLTLTNILTGAGSLTKLSAGNLILQGPVDYTGSTLLLGGTMTLGATTSLAKTPSITVSNGTTFDVTLPGGLTLNGSAGQILAGGGTINGAVTAPVGSWVNPGMSPGTLTFNTSLALNSAASTFELGSNPYTPGASDLVVVNGTGLTLSGVSTVKIVPLATLDTVNPYTLFQNYGTPLPSGSEASLNVVSDSRYNFIVLPTDNYFGAQVNVQVSGSGTPAQLIWRGNNAVNPTYWDNKVTTNWLNGASGDKFYAGDTAVFDDSAIGTTAALIGTLQPAQLVLKNAIKAITMVGPGNFNAGSLTNDSAGATTIGNAAGNQFTFGLTQNSGTLLFTNTGANTFGAGMTVNAGALSFANTGVNNFGAGVTMNGGVLEVANSAASTFGALTLFGGGVNLRNGFANNFGSVTFIGGGTLTFDQPSNVTLGNALNGYSGTVVKTGTNVLTLSANNSGFSGPIQVAAGTLRAGNAAALGDTIYDTAISSGATLDVNALNLGNEPITVSGAGIGGLGAIVNNSGTGQNNALHDVTLAGDTTFGGTGRWDIRTNATGFANLLTSGNSYNLTKVGANQISLVSANVDSMLGDIGVQQGIFSYELLTTSLGDPTKTVTVASNAVLQMWACANPLDKLILLKDSSRFIVGSGTANRVDGPVTLQSGMVTLDVASGVSVLFTNTLSGAAGLQKVNSGTLTLSASNTFTGPTFVAAGTLQLGNNTRAGSLQPQPGGVLTNNGTLIFNRSEDFTFSDQIVGSGGVQQIGADTVTLTASNTFAGQTYLNSLTTSAPNGGALRISNSYALGDAVGNTHVNGNSTGNGRLELVGGLTVAEPLLLDARQAATLDTPHLLNVSGNNTMTGAVTGNTGGSDYNFQVDAGKLTMTGSFICPSAGGTRRLKLLGDASGEWKGAISNSADNLTATIVVKTNSGTWTLSGTNIYNGVTVIGGGTLALAATGSMSNTPSIDVQAGATFDVSAVAGFTLAARQTLKGNGTVTGSVIAGPSAVVAAGESVGALTVTGSLVLAAGSTNLVEVDKFNAINDVIHAASVTYGGTLVVSEISGTPLSAGDSFKLFKAAPYSGAFAAISPVTPGAGLAWDTSALTTTGTLRVAVAAPAIGSVNLLPDGNVSLTLDGVIGQAYSIRVSPDVAVPIATWTVLSSGTIPSVPFTYTDVTATNSPQRFYIISSP